jgi:hypothetical protein
MVVTGAAIHVAILAEVHPWPNRRIYQVIALTELISLALECIGNSDALYQNVEHRFVGTPSRGPSLW